MNVSRTSFMEKFIFGAQREKRRWEGLVGCPSMESLCLYCVRRYCLRYPFTRVYWRDCGSATLFSSLFSVAALQCPCLQIPVTRALKIDLFHMSDLVAPLAHSECQGGFEWGLTAYYYVEKSRDANITNLPRSYRTESGALSEARRDT